MSTDFQILFEEMNRNIDKPMEYNRLVSSVLAELVLGDSDDAKRDLSNLLPTAIPAGVNLESLLQGWGVEVPPVSDPLFAFRIKTKDQTSVSSGRIEVRSGSVSGNFISGSAVLISGDNTNTSGTGTKTGSAQVLSGTITGGTAGSTGSVAAISGSLFFSALTNYGFGSTGFVTLASGAITFQQGGTLTNGSTGTINIRSGDINDTLGTGNLTANTGFIDIKSGENSAKGISGNIRIRSGSNKNPNSTTFDGVSGYLIANTGKSLNGQSGSLHLYTGSVSANKMQIPIWGTYNEEPAFDNSAGLKGTGHISISTGYIENAANSIQTGRMVLKTGYTLGTGNSGNFDIETGDVASGTSGSINIKTGTSLVGRGDVKVSARYLELNDSTRIVLNSSSGDNVLARLQISDAVGQYGHLFFNRFLPSSEIYIGAMESAINYNGAPVRFSGAWSMSNVSGVYKGSDVYLQTRSYANVLNASDVSLNSGDIFIQTQNAYVQGSYTNANSGNINLSTGTSQGTGTRGFISLDGDYISANSAQIKNVADATDPNDAVNLAQLQAAVSGGGGDFANKDLSNLTSPTAIPAGVSLTSLQVPSIPNPFASFEIHTTDQNGSNGSGGVKVFSGNIFNILSSQNTGKASLNSGLTLGSGSTGGIDVYSGDNVGSGLSGSIDIRSGVAAGNNTGSVSLHSGNSFSGASGNVEIFSGSSTAYSGNINLTTGSRTGNKPRGGIVLNGQGVDLHLRNQSDTVSVDPNDNHSLFIIRNTSPSEGGGQIQFLTYAQGNNTMGMRIFDSSPASGFSIKGWGRLNQNGGPFDFISTGASVTTNGTLTGGNFNIMANSTDYIDPALGINASVNSGNVNISTANGYIVGTNTDANSGNINIFTGQKQGSGARGDINLDAKAVVADVDVFFKVTTPGSANEVWLGNTSYAQLGGPFLYASAIATNRTFEIGGQGVMNLTPGTTELHGAAIISDTDGNYASGKLELRTKVETGTNANNASYSSGDIEIYTGDGTVYGSGFPDANSGNVIIRTGNKEGSGTRGTISLSASSINANLAQIKNVANGTDASDAVNKSQLDAMSPDQTVFVSKNGSDSNTGKSTSPFLTIAQALASITDASPTKRYVIKVAAGSYTETSVVLKANVFIVGCGQKEAVRITGAVSLDSSFSGSGDHRSGFSEVILLSACDFNWQTVTSAAGKLYFNEVSFSSTVNMYGHNNATAQAQFNDCVIFQAMTISGINVGVYTNCFNFSNITLNQHPNGGMPTILNMAGGYCSGTVNLVTTVNDFNRRCAIFARSFWINALTINGASSYADVTYSSLPPAGPTILNGGNIVYLNPSATGANTALSNLAFPTAVNNPIMPATTNATNLGDWGKQWQFNFGYVHASTGTDMYVTSVMGSYDPAGDSAGRSIFIQSDGYGLQTNVNGGNIEIETAGVSGTGIRGEIVLNARRVDVKSTKIVNLANGTDPTDAINLSQLTTLQNKTIVGQFSMANGASSFLVDGLTIGTTNYIVVVTVENTVDATVRHLVATVTAKTTTSFTFVTPQTTDSANYKANYIITKL